MTAQQSYDLRGRVCLVTGATSGIGRETALGLARSGATVLIVARDPESEVQQRPVRFDLQRPRAA